MYILFLKVICSSYEYSTGSALVERLFFFLQYYLTLLMHSLLTKAEGFTTDVFVLCNLFLCCCFCYRYNMRELLVVRS
jgi:hypothetical protein